MLIPTILLYKEPAKDTEKQSETIFHILLTIIKKIGIVITD
jgi:hypothetical protein